MYDQAVNSHTKRYGDIDAKKELEADLPAIQQIEFVEQLRKTT